MAFLSIVYIDESNAYFIDLLMNRNMMTQKEMENLVECYILLEGYTDLRSIFDMMQQEYPGEFDRKQALLTIRKVLREVRD